MSSCREFIAGNGIFTVVVSGSKICLNGLVDCISSWSDIGGAWINNGSALEYDGGNTLISAGNLDVTNGKITANQNIETNQTLKAKTIVLQTLFTSSTPLGTCTSGNLAEIRYYATTPDHTMKICSYKQAFGYGWYNLKIE